MSGRVSTARQQHVLHIGSRVILFILAGALLSQRPLGAQATPEAAAAAFGKAIQMNDWVGPERARS